VTPGHLLNGVSESSESPRGEERPQRPFSLRLRLVLLGTLVLVVALGLVGIALNAANERSAVSALQGRMESSVYLVLAAADADDAGRLVMQPDLGDPRLSQPGSGIYVHLHGGLPEGVDHWSSPSALGLQLPELPLSAPGLSRFSEPSDELAFYSFQYGVSFQSENGAVSPFTVTVLVDPDEVQRQTSAFRLGLWRALVTAGLILVAAQLFMFMLGFRPLRRVAQDVARIESGRASRLEGRYPSELEPLARNVNRLLDTEKSNQQRIRNALDSLAHSLKTPLAVIQAGLELHGGKAAQPMQNAADEINRLIATRMERAGASARSTLGKPVAVQAQLERILESLQKVYSHKLIETSVTIDDELKFYGEKRDLMELMGNLLDNAFKYGAGRIRLSAGAIDQTAARPGLWLRVEDDGPGVDESKWHILVQRGVRGDERVEGHGLGLAIVTELVAAYGGEVSIGHSEMGGAMIRVEIPAVP
jgi:two-component system sensor histidine kinase PhoQ